MSPYYTSFAYVKCDFFCIPLLIVGFYFKTHRVEN